MTGCAIDSAAFNASAFLAPVVVAAPGWVFIAALRLFEGAFDYDFVLPGILGVLVIAACAPILGWPTYLALGLPAFRYALIKGQRKWWQVALCGSAANLASTPFVGGAFMLLLSPAEDWLDLALSATLWFIGVGALVAPLWSAVFALIYSWSAQKED